MSLLPSRAARSPCPTGPGCALLALLLLLLTSPGSLASARRSAAIQRELRCVCLTITPTIRPKMISNLEVISAGPQCPNAELIATLKNGRQVCLDPEAPLIKKIIQKILNSGKQKN